MTERGSDPQVSALYLQLASECFNKAATAKDAGAAEALQQMGRSYFVQAVALNPSLGNQHFEFPRKDPQNMGG